MGFRRPLQRLEDIPNVRANAPAAGETIVRDSAAGTWVAGAASPPPAGSINKARYGSLAIRPAADGTQGTWFDTDTNPPTQYLDTGTWQPIGTSADEITKRALIFGG